jgi:hypothetical protein
VSGPFPGDFSYWDKGKLANVFAFKPDIVTIKLGTGSGGIRGTVIANEIIPLIKKVAEERGRPREALWRSKA